MHLERTTSELEFKSEKSKILTFSLEFNGQVLIGQTGLNLEFIQTSEHSEPDTGFCHYLVCTGQTEECGYG